MEQIIKSIALKFNLPEATVRQAVGVVLNFVKQKSTGNAFERFAALVPGTIQAASTPPRTAASGSGLLGGLVSRAGGLLGGNVGSAAEILGALQQTGIPLDKAGPLAGEFLQQAKAVAGPDVVNQLLQSVPQLQSFLEEQAPSAEEPPASE